MPGNLTLQYLQCIQLESLSMCLQHTSNIPVSGFPAVLQPGLWLQLKLFHNWRGCSGKWSYRGWHTSDLRTTLLVSRCLCCSLLVSSRLCWSLRLQHSLLVSCGIYYKSPSVPAVSSATLFKLMFTCRSLCGFVCVIAVCVCGTHAVFVCGMRDGLIWLGSFHYS